MVLTFSWQAQGKPRWSKVALCWLEQEIGADICGCLDFVAGAMIRDFWTCGFLSKIGECLEQS